MAEVGVATERYAKSAVSLRTGMLAYGGFDVGQPGRPLHTGWPSIATRPIATRCLNLTGVTDRSAQNLLSWSAKPGQSTVVQRLAPLVKALRLRICTGSAGPLPRVVPTIGLSVGLALPVFVKSVLGSHPMSIVRPAPALW